MNNDSQASASKAELAVLEQDLFDVWVRHKGSFKRGAVLSRQAAADKLGIRLLRLLINAGVFDDESKKGKVISVMPGLVREQEQLGASTTAIDGKLTPKGVKAEATKEAKADKKAQDAASGIVVPSRKEVLRSKIAELPEEKRPLLRAIKVHSNRHNNRVNLKDLKADGYGKDEAISLLEELGVRVDNPDYVHSPNELKWIEV